MIHLACAAAACLLATGGQAPRVADSPSAVVPGAGAKALPPDLGEVYRRLDPAVDGWDEEVLGDAVDHQLHDVADAIAELLRGGRVALEGVLAPSFEGEFPTRFAEWKEGRSGVAVRRSTATGRVEDGFVEAFRRLLSSFAGAARVSSKFKLLSVEPSEEEATTRVFVQIWGRTPSRFVQQGSTWVCRWTIAPDRAHPRLAAVRVEDFEESAGPEGGTTLFEDCTEAVLGANPSYREQLVPGVDAWTARLDARAGLSVLGHEGIAIADVNGDLLDDLFVCQPGGLPNRLFVRNPDGTATDRSAEAGVDYLDAGRSALLVDLDGDADADLAFLAGADLLFLANDGRGRFTPAGSHPAPSSSAMAAADTDLDGDLDLYVCGYAVPDRPDSTPAPYFDANNGKPNLFLRNDGSFRFADATRETGLDENNRRFSLAAGFEDFDEDGDPDLFVANDFGRDNLYRNEGGRFRDAAAELGADDIGAGMGVAWGDVDGDGRLDLHVSNMFSSAGSRMVGMARFKPGLDAATRGHFRHHARGDTLFRNLPGGFRDESERARITVGRWAWGARFLDWNGDGLEDLFVTNGFVGNESGPPGDL